MRRLLLWLRGAVFTIAIPGVVAGWVPYRIANRMPARGPWSSGWLAIWLGAAIYLACLLRFLQAGGTPMIFFMRAARFAVGQEPPRLVRRGLYERSRNPMYIGVLTVVAGQSILFASAAVALYGLLLFAVFHLVVRTIEEPHLRATRGREYDEYCRRVPRWI